MRLLLHVNFERPVLCDFVVLFDVTDRPDDELWLALALLLAASGPALAFHGFTGSETTDTWVPMPACRESVLDHIAVGSRAA